MKLRLIIAYLGVLLFVIIPSELSAQESKAFLYLFLEEECPICQYYTLDLRNMYEKYHKQGIEFVGLFPFLNTTEAGRNTFAETYKIPFLLRADEDQQLAKLFQVKITPEVILTDSAGEIVYRGRIDNAFERPGRRRRVVTKHELTDALDAVLSGQEVPVAQTKAVGCFITFAPKNP